MVENGQLPAGAQGMAIFVMLYTLVNAVAAGMVVLMHIRHGDAFGYPPVCAVFMVMNIVAAFIQQVHHYVNYTDIVTASFNWRHGQNRTGRNAFTGTYTDIDTSLYEIQLYCYNVESLMFLLWVANLCRHVWRVRIGAIERNEAMTATVSKILAITVPALLIGVANATAVDRSPGISLILANICLAASVALGLVFLGLVFSKYLSIRQHLGSSGERSGIFARMRWRLKFSAPGSQETNSRPSQLASSQMQSSKNQQELPHSYGQNSASRKVSAAGYDKWLVLRFGICFIVLCIMQIFSIYYSVSQYLSTKVPATDSSIDLSAAGALGGLGLFMPGVTLGLLVFIVFGTTKAFRTDYARWARALLFCSRPRRNASTDLRRTESVIHLTHVSFNDAGCTSSVDAEAALKSSRASSPDAKAGGGDARVVEVGKGMDAGEAKNDHSIYVSRSFGAE